MLDESQNAAKIDWKKMKARERKASWNWAHLRSRGQTTACSCAALMWLFECDLMGLIDISANDFIVRLDLEYCGMPNSASAHILCSLTPCAPSSWPEAPWDRHPWNLGEHVLYDRMSQDKNVCVRGDPC